MSLDKSKYFCNLRTFSHYSIGESIVKLDELVMFAKENKYMSLAICDRMNMFGSYEFVSLCIKNKIKPILGCLLHVESIGYIPVFVKNIRAYESVSRAISYTYIKELERMSWDDFLTITDCIYLTGEYMSKEHVMKLKAIAKNDLYVEVQNNTHKHNMLQIASELALPIVYANNAFYVTKNDLEKYYIMNKVHNNQLYNQQELSNLKPINAINFNTPFPYEEGINNIEHIIKKCNFNFEKHELLLPKYCTNEEETIRDLCYKGLYNNVIFTTDEEEQLYKNRLEYELSVLISKGYLGYFLICADFIAYANREGIPIGPGRGSAAGSLVSYCLNITSVDPIKFQLIFERFLNPERASAPDIDLDVCPNHRERLRKYLIEKYGAYNIANIITFGKIHARGAVRDVFRVLGFSFYQSDEIVKLIPQDQVNPITLAEAIETVPKLKSIYNDNAKYRKAIDIAISLEGIVRNTSIHAAGTIICSEPIFKYCPLVRTDNELVTQMDMKSIDSLGCVKFDFLGLRTLTIINTTIKDVEINHGVKLDINKIPLDDHKVFEIIQSLYLEGVFQFENAGMRNVIKLLQPDNINDMIALNALWRPGPIARIPDYIARKNGTQSVEYAHPLLEPILKDTFGIFVYQEQVMAAATNLANYSLAEADLLRRAMGKKKHEEMVAHRSKFVENSAKNGVPNKIANEIFDQMQEFSGYGFNKSHSTPYSIIAYICAYLKANYPLEFFTACFNYEYNDSIKTLSFIHEARSMGIEILPPSINKSKDVFSIEGKAIRFGLVALKNIGKEISVELYRFAPYKNIGDFLHKNTDIINKKIWESLVYSGALDCIEDRVNLMASYEDVMAGNLLHRSKRNVSLMEQMDNEQKAFGFYFHSPSRNYAPFGRYCTIRKSYMLKSFYTLAEIIIVSVRRSKTSSYAFLKVADHTGILDLTVFGNVLQQSSNLLKVGELLMFECTNEMKNGVNQYTCKKVIRFDDYLNMFSILQVSANNNHHLATLKSIIANYTGGNKKVQVMSDIEDMIISTNTRICRGFLDDLIQSGINIHYLL